jgi:hypothetical protein
MQALSPKPITSLNLHFWGKKSLADCLDQLTETSVIPFEYTVNDPDPRDILSKPEFANVQAVAMLQFKDNDSVLAFMDQVDCYTIYQEYATKEDGDDHH